VTDGDGMHVPDALIEIWQADPAGRYPASPWGARRSGPPPAAFPGFGRCGTDDGGWYRFVTLKPGRVPGAKRDALQAPHIAMIVQARGLLHRLVTRVYFPDEPDANAADPALSSIADRDRAATLVARPEEGILRFDIRLQGDGETCFFDV
jgi:protocatechuate 3,4-dioxygenase alpha subunit